MPRSRGGAGTARDASQGAGAAAGQHAGQAPARWAPSGQAPAGQGPNPRSDSAPHSGAASRQQSTARPAASSGPVAPTRETATGRPQEGAARGVIPAEKRAGSAAAARPAAGRQAAPAVKPGKPSQGRAVVPAGQGAQASLDLSPTGIAPHRTRAGGGPVVRAGTTHVDRRAQAVESAAQAAENRAPQGRTGPRAAQIHRSNGPSTRPTAGARSARRRPASRETEQARLTTPTPQVEAPAQVASEKGMSRPMAVLVLVMSAVIAATIVVGPMRTWLDQRAERAALVQELAEARQRNEEMRRELAQWEDPNVVRREARDRLGFVQPGERIYIVTDSSVAQPQTQETADPQLRVDRKPDSWVYSLWQGQSPSSIPRNQQPTAPPGIITEGENK